MEHLRDPSVDTGDTPLSHAVIDDRYVFLSGLVAADVQDGGAAVGDAAAETRTVMTAIAGVLDRLELTLAQVVRVTVHLVDLDDMPAVDGVYGGFFAAGQFPARTCVEVSRLVGGCRVEITAIARRH
jgi:2-iminobutanoate/2-iminopropanoate deaminase